MHKGDKMGNYNTQYQSYYNNLAKKQKGSNKFSSEGNIQSRITKFYIKRVTKELIGVLVLLIFVLFFKVVVTPKTQYVYNYSKQAINKQYNYSNLLGKVKDVKFKDIQGITVNFFEKVKSTISSGDTINDKNIGF